MAEKKPARKPAAKKAPVQAVTTARVVTKAGNWLIEEGHAYPADHPAVKAHPHLFGDVVETVPYVRTARVERATAAPGAKRG